MDPAKKKDIVQLLKILKEKKWHVYTDAYKLNIVGVRNKNVNPKKFDDALFVFWKDAENKWNFRGYAITSDPSVHYLRTPMPGSGGGTAILKEGQYVDAYKIGLHRGEYPALVQQAPVTVYRDYDRNALLLLRDKLTSTGQFGINIHRAKAQGTTDQIDLWSAGCQVFADAEDFKEFLSLLEKQRSLYGNSFTYTLIDEWIRQQHETRNTILGLSLVSIFFGTGYFLYKKFIAK